ncbi:UbiA prenyltransferase family-domain-containing protein [Lipomyces arxii]|uniref:UbiA prenyltransferase family-domain-containing protein n=1 Tax=Lipomyces arxii TaxID=56418 RepID=UPI0034CF2382
MALAVRQCLRWCNQSSTEMVGFRSTVQAQRRCNSRALTAMMSTITIDFFRSNGDIKAIDSRQNMTRLFSQTMGLFHGGSPEMTMRNPPTRFRAFMQLGKPRLTALIVLSTMSAYAVTPETAYETGSSLGTLLWLTVGTGLTSMSANALNMAREPVFDGMMSRTRARPIVRGLVSPRQAFIFAAFTGTFGAAALYLGVNPDVAALAVFNIFLYAGVYTSLKRTSIINTWAGAVVGAIPPLMGWSAAGGSLMDPAAWCLAGLLYAWQFPHFNALSFPIREEYKMAGYYMTAWVNPQLNARVALRYSLAMIPLCIGIWYFGVTDSFFVVDSTVMNIWLSTCAVQFWKECRSPILGRGATASARKLFWASIWQLPAVLVFSMVHKTGLWRGIFDWGDEKSEAIEELFESE